MGKIRVACYGTLRVGQRAEHMLLGSKVVFSGFIDANYDMFDLGSFPAIMESEETKKIYVDVYELSRSQEKSIMKRLDSYEGYSSDGNGLYDRRRVDIPDVGKAYIYYMKRKRQGKLIKNGDWVAYVNENKN